MKKIFIVLLLVSNFCFSVKRKAQNKLLEAILLSAPSSPANNYDSGVEDNSEDDQNAKEDPYRFIKALDSNALHDLFFKAIENCWYEIVSCCLMSKNRERMTQVVVDYKKAKEKMVKQKKKSKIVD